MSAKSRTTLLSKRFTRFLRFSRGASIGFSILAIMIILGFLVSLFSPYDPRRWNTVPSKLPPSAEHLLGTTTLGQDLFWLTTHALRNSLIIGVLGSTVGLFIGAVLGLIGGYKGGLTEAVILLFGDVFVVVPVLPIIVLLGSLVKESLGMFTLGLIIGLLTLGMPIRNVRSQILSLREREFTNTAVFSNMSTLEIIIHEYLPHTLPWIMASFINRILMAMGMEITLAVFGLISLSEATLGNILYWALRYQALMTGLWWWITTPIFTVALLFVALYLLSVSVAEYLDPRQRLRRVAKG